MDDSNTLDSTYDGERGTGSTPPETGSESSNVVGRPAVERPQTAFHAPEDDASQERRPFDPHSAANDGGSFDGVAPVNPNSPP